MKKIASFEVDHTKLLPGVYISRVDYDIVTYDIRVKRPNADDFLPVPSTHTIEHLFATYARNCEVKEKVIYFGPMGCRTGFYFLLKDTDHKIAVKVIKDAFKFIADFDGEIPGTTAIECGNYLEHDLDGAKKIATEYLHILENVTEKTLNY